MKKLLKQVAMAAVAFGCVLSTRADCTTAPLGLVSWWRGDTNALDQVGGNQGFIAGGINYVPGKVGQAFNFNGSDAVLLVPARSNLNVGTGGGLTLDAWINPSDVSSTHPLLEWNNGLGSVGAHLWIAQGLFANLVDNLGIDHIIRSVDGAITVNSAQHIALTYDQATGLATLYRNGSMLVQTNLGSFTPQTSHDLYFGFRASGGGAGTRYAGVLDEIDVFNRALPASEIQAIYNADTAGKCLPPKTNFTVAGDFSTNSNPNGPWSYGWKSTVGGAFTAGTFVHPATLQNGAQTVGWTRFFNSESSVTKNFSAFTGIQMAGSVTTTIPAGSVYVHPGQNSASDNFGAIRFTVPAGGAGNYQVRARGYSIYTGAAAGDTDFHLVVNGAEVFGQAVPASTGAVTNGAGYTNTLALAVGDTVDLLVGRGADNNLDASGENVEFAMDLVSITPIPPTILAQPQNQSALVGSSATFAVVANGTPPLAYQWLFNGTNLAGATNTTLLLTNIQLSQGGNYSVLITNAPGFTNSSNATLTVNQTPTNFTVAGEFSATANPNGPWSYGWKTTVGGAFTPDTFSYSTSLQNGAQVAGWTRFFNSESSVTKNISAFTGIQMAGSVTTTIPAGSVYVHAGQNGASDNFGAIRFTVPPGGTGIYQVRARGYSIYTGAAAGDTDFHVVVNGVEVFGQAVPASTGAVTNGAGYTNTVLLAAGDTVDLLVGRGADNNLDASGENVEFALALVSTNVPPKTSFTLAGDFSTSANVSGPWSYGWKSTVGGAFTPSTFSYSTSLQNGAQVAGWTRFFNSESFVARNTSPFTGIHVSGMATSTIPSGGVYWSSGQNANNDNFGAVRFTVPAGGTGVYRLRSHAYSLYVGTGAGDSDFHVVVNGTEAFSQAVPASTGAVTNGTRYTNTFILAAGDTVDFLVGRGADNDLDASGQNVEVALDFVSSVPILSVGRNGEMAEISWPVTVVGFTLESLTNALLTNWMSIPTPPGLINQFNRVTRPVGESQQFFRLKRP